MPSNFSKALVFIDLRQCGAAMPPCFEQLHCPEDEPVVDGYPRRIFVEFNSVENKASYVCKTHYGRICLYNPGETKKRRAVSLPKDAAVRNGPLRTMANDLRRPSKRRKPGREEKEDASVMVALVAG